MTEVKNIKDADIAYLYTNIGRGHPGYLDGIIEAIETTSPEIKYFVTDVFALSRGLSLFGWRRVRGMYRLGARGGLISSAYGLLRRFSGGGRDPQAP